MGLIGPDYSEEEEKNDRRQIYELRRIVHEIVLLHWTFMKFANSCAKGRRTVSFGFKVGLVKPKTKGTKMPLEIEITNEQEVPVTLSPKTDTNKPSTLDGKPAWSVVQGNSQVVTADDGLSAVLVSSDDPGDTVILVKADADLGDGIQEISDTITLRVIGATAKNLGLVAGAPRAKTPATPPPDGGATPV